MDPNTPWTPPASVLPSPPPSAAPSREATEHPTTAWTSPAAAWPAPAWPPPARPAPAPPASAPEVRLSGAAITGIVLASVLTLATVIGAGIGAVLSAPVVARWSQAGQGGQGGDLWGGGITDDEAQPAVERISSDELEFWFPAALELYNDGRLDHLCAAEHELGCWEVAVIPEAACDLISIQTSFSNDPDGDGELTHQISRTDVAAGEAIEIAFGEDDYAFGWISNVSCIESSPPADTTASLPR
ncbi:hypothetical protein FLP10_14570 [Agromyces intestinalis]|uniref:Uncharacterized protein n=1 Tax=Agromyces intestinalis TaxID=2592652 RepID=A0A5C1YKA7_9MICO|nr:hypothetical protein [Agromyces intestinalis]QEO15517.1 hypothetical protein FLP10_14570 [Agromyces intestinalis]